MNILTRKREFLQLLAPHISRKVSRLFSFGCDTLIGHEVISTRANARWALVSWPTAKSKMWRLLGNGADRIDLLHPCITKLSLVSGDDVVAIDFSRLFRDGQAGSDVRSADDARTSHRSAYFQVLEYPIEKKTLENLFVIEAIKRFFVHAGSTPTLVFDRGFACPSIIRFLAQNNYTFIIRIKKRKSLADFEDRDAMRWPRTSR